MNPSAVSAADSSLLMWVLAAVVAMMTASICQGWLRQAQLTPQLRENWKISILGAVVLGTGFTTAVVLALSAEPLPFALGYRLRDAPLLWLGSMLAFWPPLALLGCNYRWPHLLGGGAMIALVGLALPVGWLLAAGFRPGIAWRWDAVAVAALCGAAGTAVSLFMVLSNVARANHRRFMWRLGAALLMGISLLGMQQLLLVGANLPEQVGAVFASQLPSSVLCLAAGVMVPFVWSLLLLDLYLRRKEQRRLERREKHHRRLREQTARESRSLLSTAAHTLAEEPPSATPVTSSAAATATPRN
jgi:NO-binding membrane sensor protein with MHYT domain